MPLTGIPSKDVHELMMSYGKDKKIGTSRPKNKKAAQKQAVAIALETQRRKGK